MAQSSDTSAFASPWKQVKFAPQPEEGPVMDTPTNQPRRARLHFRRRAKVVVGSVLGVVLVLLVIGGVASWSVYSQVQAMKSDMMMAVQSGREAYAAFKAQNLPEVRTKIQTAQSQVDAAKAKYTKLAWLKMVPLARAYYIDGEHGFAAGEAGARAALKVVAAIEPHADVLGFSGEGTFTGGSTENRIALILETLGQITPVLDDISSDIQVVEENLTAIDARRYPEQMMGYPLRSYVVRAQEGAAAARLALTEFRPVIEQLPRAAGADQRRKYLVLFLNDNELRPGGGFITAYAVVFVENGVITAEKSDDVYELDKKFSRKPPIPEQLGRFLVTESRWNLRDMNIDPNFEQAMQTFYQYYDQVPGEPDNIDGIIAVDTNVLERIVAVLGPVEVPGYGTFSSEKLERCDCPQIIYALSEIIDRPTPYLRENRKGILAPLMQSIIKKTYDTSRDKWPLLAELVWKSIEGRHVQMYFLDPELQAAAKAANAAGIVPAMPQNGSDYLTVVDANLAGAKSNLFVDVAGTITVDVVSGGSVKKTVELVYRNTHAPSNCNLEAGQLCLNGLLNDWTRWYMPKGAQVSEVLGLEEGYKVDTSHPDFDVLEGIFKLAPLSQAKVRVTYTVPYTLTEGYELRMQKQAGTDPIPFTLETPMGETTFTLDKDITVRVP